MATLIPDTVWSHLVNRLALRKILVAAMFLQATILQGLFLSSPTAHALDSTKTLTGLSVGTATLSPAFTPENLTYTASVPMNTASINVTPTFSGTGETVQVNGTSVTSGNSVTVSLVVGLNTINVETTAEDLSSDTYTIGITLRSVTYDLNGGLTGDVPSSETVTSGDTYVVAFNSGNVKRSGFRFLGWSTDASDGAVGTIYKPGFDSFTVTSNTTLFAKWDNPYGFGLYVDKPFVQNSYVYNPTDATTKLETADGLDLSSSCPDLAIGTVSGNAACSVYSSGIYGGASTTTSVPTVGNTTPGSKYFGIGGGVKPAESQIFTINFAAPQSYFGFWWSGASPTDTIKFFNGTNLLATMTTSNLMTKLQKNNSTDYSSNTVLAPSGATYPKGYYYGNPRVYGTTTPTSFPTSDINGIGDPNFHIYTGAFIYGYIHAFGSGGVTFDKITLSGSTSGGFELDNLVISSTEQTPDESLISDQFFSSSYFVAFEKNGSASTSMSDQGSTSATNLSSNTYSRTGFTFSGWNTKADGSGRSLANNAEYSFDSNITLYAVWTPNTVTGAVSGLTGGSVSATDVNSDGTWNLVATPNAGYSFVGWSCTASQTPASASTATTTITPTANTTCTASFEAANYLVTTDTNLIAGGSASATDANTDGTWDLVATPNAGYSFVGWSCTASQTPATAFIATTTITPTANTTCTATFVAIPYSVTPATNLIAGGTVTATDANTDGTWDLVATPNAGYSFVGWSCTASQTPVSTSTATTTITPTADTTCTATFELIAKNGQIPLTPLQSSQIINAPSACYASTSYQVTGIFDTPVSNIAVNGQPISSTSWTQTLNKISISLPSNLSGVVGIQIFNGTSPQLPLVTCATTPLVAIMANSLAFDVYFNMNSTTLDSKNKAIIRTQYRKLLTNLNSKSEVVVKVTGWVQPTKSSPNVRILSKGRAKSVVSYLQSLGLKAKYSLQSPGHQKLNIAKSRRASVEITWSTLK